MKYYYMFLLVLGVFFIAYVICMILFGCPLVYLETTLGQYANGGPLTAWKVIPLFRGLGYCMVTTTFLISTYYMTEVTWAIYYFGVAMSTALGGRKLPWDFRNKSEEVLESDSIYLFQTNLPQYDSVADVSAGERTPHSLQYTWTIQYFYSNVLNFPGSASEFGFPVWYIVLCLLLAWVCVYASLLHGPSSIGKVMYLTAPYPYIGLPVLFVFSLFNDGSLEGIRFFLSPDWKTLAGVQIWKDAAQLMFFTLSLGTGCLHTLAGYTHFHSHCFRNLVLICLCNVMAVMFGGLTVCSGLGIFANMTNVSVSDIQFTEYELGFVLYPYILMNISESAALSMLFFSIIIVIGLDTLVIYVQTLVGAITEKMVNCGIGCSRMTRWMVQLVLCAVLSIIGLVFTTKGGILALNFVDSYISQICPYVVATLECCLLMYIFGARKFVHNIEDMTGHKNSPWWMCNWKFLSPCILLALIVCSIMFPVHVRYRDLAYPDWTEILGWCLSVLPLVCIPGCGLKAFLQQPGTFTQRLKELLRTPHGWGAGLINSHDHDNSAPDYVICHPDNHRPVHGLAMLTANLYVPQLTPLSAEEVPQETSSEMTGGYLSDLITVTSTDSIESGPENEERGNWRGKLEFILSCLGYVVGLGNIWRFPYLVYRNGGGAFFIPYLIMLTFCGIPLVFMEMGFGQYASLGPVTIWRAVPLFKGVGYAMVVSVAFICVYYNVINAWAFHYLFSSFTANLPWASCDNKWNTEACRLNKYQVTNCSLLNETFLDEPTVNNTFCGIYLQECIKSDNQTQFLQDNITGCISWLHGKFGDALYIPERQNMMANLKDPSEEYFHNQVLNESDGLQNMGSVQWQLALYLLLCWVIVFMCLVRGIYSAGKVAYFVVIIPIILLVVLLICAMMVEGHLEGIRFYVNPKWDKVLTMQVWSDAASQVFFSLSACSGGLTTLSSYNKFHNNIYRDAILICIVDTLMSILAGFTVFASMGILAHQLNTTVDNVVTSNIGLVFVAFPAAVTNFQPSAMWSAFFFLMIVMMGMSSILVMTEIIITVIMDENVEIFRKSRILVLLITCSVLYLLGLPMTTEGGLYLLQLLDQFCGGTPNVVIGIFMCVGLAWVYKIRHFCTDLGLMLGRPVSWWWRGMWCFVSPVIMIFILVSAIITGVNLKTEHYPVWAEPLAITLTVLCVISIPGYAVKKICNLEGPIRQRIQEACLSQDNWGPALIKHWKHVEYYPAVNTHTLSVDIEQSPVHAIADRVDFSTSQVRLPKLSEATLISHNKQMSPKRPQELRQKAILNHAYSNPQCNMSNGSIDQIKPRLSFSEISPSGDVLIVTRKKLSIGSQDAATQTDARSFTLALKQGSVRSLKEMKIETDVNPSTSCNTLQVEVTKF
ncbi:uncharacterized protein LOC123556538 [Mercenaria mercenaria]|uniref:uncharacterized protein LOC123556538 n=1 Tax=Mercenaria mercenaria TaxID=6596 RepID=UPI00234EDBBB|nr:uncharacterized protein LOC123556538 [Mercenaria mercenaria]